ncbi:MAG: HAD family phosphatase [Clostridia bacterium]|nr:HAD family phosphatase [Clostridia bacterium]
MGKFQGILICTDLDGTLLRADKSVSEENLAAIDYFRAEEGAFTFVTGRMPFYATDICRAVRSDVPFGCINGGGIYDPREGKYLWQHTPLSPSVCELLEHVDRHMPGIGFQLNTFEKLYTCKNTPALENFRRVTKMPYVPCHHRDVPGPLAKAVLADFDPDNITRLHQLLAVHPLASEFDLVRSERTLFEILPNHTHKGLLIPKMAEVFGTTVEKTVAVGDYYNDIPMLREAGVGVAVANALPEVKAAADYVLAATNEEHAIAAIIRDIENGGLLVK